MIFFVFIIGQPNSYFRIMKAMWSIANTEFCDGIDPETTAVWLLWKTINTINSPRNRGLANRSVPFFFARFLRDGVRYPTILGGVIFGIGIALYVERYGYKSGIRGLGLGGAIAINICGGLVLLIWLLVNPFDLPIRGYIVLWIIALLVLLLGIKELASKSCQYWYWRCPALPRKRQP